MRRLKMLILLTLLTIHSYGQEKKIIKGIATDGHRNPIIACNVMIKGTTIGTNTDVCGEFSLPVEHDAVTLVFHGMSYDDWRVYEIRLKSSDIKDDFVRFQLGHLRVENPECKKKVDKKLKRYMIH